MLFSNRGDGRPRRRSPAVQKGYRPCRGRRRAGPRNHGAAGTADAAVMPRFFRTDGAVAPPITAIAGIPGGGHMTLRTGASLPRIASEGKRTASGLTRNQMPGNGLRVRIPCPPLLVSAVLAGILVIPGLRLEGPLLVQANVCSRGCRIQTGVMAWLIRRRVRRSSPSSGLGMCRGMDTALA